MFEDKFKKPEVQFNNELPHIEVKGITVTEKSYAGILKRTSEHLEKVVEKIKDPERVKNELRNSILGDLIASDRRHYENIMGLDNNDILEYKKKIKRIVNYLRQEYDPNDEWNKFVEKTIVTGGDEILDLEEEVIVDDVKVELLIDQIKMQAESYRKDNLAKLFSMKEKLLMENNKKLRNLRSAELINEINNSLTEIDKYLEKIPDIEDFGFSSAIAELYEIKDQLSKIREETKDEDEQINSSIAA